MTEKWISKNDAIEDYSRALDQDHRCRFSGVKGDLHSLPLRDLHNNWAIDPPLPTVYQHYETDRNRRHDIPEYAPYPDSDQEFAERFFQAYPFMKGLDFSGLLVAGGSICRLLKYQRNDSRNGDYGRYYYGNNGVNATSPFEGKGDVDLDIFFYGLNEEEALKKIREVNAHFEQTELTLRYSINQFTLNIFLQVDRGAYYGGYQEIQLIFRLYTSISEILHGFDLGASSVGFDGQHVYFTSMAKFAYEYECNILDTSRRSTSYEWRLGKYLKRGFGLILPQLNLEAVKKIRNSKKEQKPDNNYSYVWDRYKKNCVALPYAYISLNEDKGNRIQGGFQPRYNINYKPKASDYGQDQKTPTRPDINIYQMNKRNCKFLMKGEYEKIRLMGNNFEDIINFRMDMDGMLSVFDQMHADFLYRLQGFPKTLKIYQKEIEQKKEIMREKFLNESTKRKITFITENPGRQLTSSINPIFEKEFEWYGVNFYIPPPEMRREIIVNALIGQKPAIKDLMTFYAKHENETREKTVVANHSSDDSDDDSDLDSS